MTFHKGDADNPADLLSQHPDTGKPYKPKYTIAEEYVNCIADTHVPFAMTKEEIIVATAEDPTLQAVKELILTNRWHEVDKYQGAEADLK